MVVNGCVGVVLAEMFALMLADSRTVAGDCVPGLLKARVGLDVNVQQISRTRPLVAVGCLSRFAWAP